MEAVNILSVPPSCLRAFVPSCKNPEASQGQPASGFYTNLIPSLGKGAKEGFVPCAPSAAGFWNRFLAQLSAPAFLFSHEGTKARRREEKAAKSRQDTVYLLRELVTLLKSKEEKKL